ncbi:MAG: hypothetical protein HZB54_06425 [Deltaproteobacteria bacterium]|nr:hypothetical protein [Deltaproteobacteria bacterium]
MNIGKIADDFRDKTAFYLTGLAVVFALIISVVAAVKWVGSVEKMVSLKKQELIRFNNVREEYLKLKKKAGMETIEKKIYAPQTEGSTGAIIQEIGRGIGIKDKISSFKPVEEKIEEGYVKNGVEVKVNGINLNQLVNLLYKIENHKNLLLIKSISIDARFDNPALLDIAMHIIFLTKKTP